MHRLLPALPTLALALPAQDDGRAEGRALLEALIEAQAGMAQMTAEYVQERTTPLTRKPLVAEGKLAFRRDPGCVVFFVREPRAAVIRLDLAHYEVWHPERARLERFVLPDDQMPRLLFDALGPTKANLERAFTVERCERVEGSETLRRLTLLPTGEDARRIASKITLTIDAKTKALRGFGYTDPRGGDVRVTLDKVELAAKADDALFRLDVPKDAQVIVQKVPERESAKGAEKTEGAKPPADKKN